MKVAVCDYGAGNVRSVIVALNRLGADASSTQDPVELTDADLAVLPGVGSARRHVRDEGARSRRGPAQQSGGRGPTLGICLGLQLALEETEEDGGVVGLGLLPGRAARERGAGASHRLGQGRTGGGGLLLRTLLRGADERGGGDVRGDCRGGAPVASSGFNFTPKERQRGCAMVGTMPLARLIPCLDVARGRVVKGVRFRGLRAVGDPVEMGAAYSDAGADELVFLDIEATLEQRRSRIDLVARIADRLAIPFTVGAVSVVWPTHVTCSERAPTRSR